MMIKLDKKKLNEIKYLRMKLKNKINLKSIKSKTNINQKNEDQIDTNTNCHNTFNFWEGKCETWSTKIEKREERKLVYRGHTANLPQTSIP
jgi:hypothetical protein